MGKDRSEILYKAGNDLLFRAEHEMERAEEDVVTHLICSNSRMALSNFLAGYLIRNEIPVHHPVTMEGLLEQCKSIDGRFACIDLSDVHCRQETHDQDYCLSVGQVEACLKAAQQAHDIVMTETPAC